MRLTKLVLSGLAALVLLQPAGYAAAAPASATADTAKTDATAETDNWYWLSSDDKYSKYVDSSSIVTEAKVKTAKGDVPTVIDAWTKTTYSYEGAKETLAAYGLVNKMPDPGKFAYSLAQVRVIPQRRTIQYLREEFYDQQDKKFYTKDNAREKEVNSQAFDEAFYDYIVDYTFGQGEVDRAQAKDRWLTLWEDRNPDGQTTYVTGDTTTMRMVDNNLILWVWQETKDAEGNVLEIKLMKKAVNLPKSTERVIQMKYWTQAQGWQTQEDAGNFYNVPTSEPGYQGIEALRKYASTHRSWVFRYNLDGR